MDNSKLTQPSRKAAVQREWHLVDVKGKVIGRIATQIAHKLMGKGKPSFARNVDGGDYVVVLNAKEIVATGKKEDEKMYSTYSGYPGGIKNKPLWKIREEKPTEIVKHAVWGMLPKNKLRHRMITRLHIYAGETHPWKAKFEKKA